MSKTRVPLLTNEPDAESASDIPSSYRPRLAIPVKCVFASFDLEIVRSGDIGDQGPEFPSEHAIAEE